MALTSRTPTTSSLASTTSINSIVPTGTTDGDLVFLLICTSSGSDTISGGLDAWTLVAAQDELADSDRYHLYMKIFRTGDSATTTITFSSNTKVRVVSNTYYGATFNTSSPVVSNTRYKTSNTSVTAAAMTIPSTDYHLFFFGAMLYVDAASMTYTKPSSPTTGWVENYDNYETTSDFGVTFCAYTWTSSGTTGTMTATSSRTAATKHAFAVGISSTANSRVAASGRLTATGRLTTTGRLTSSTRRVI